MSKHIKTGLRLGSAFGAIMVLMLALGIFAMTQLSSLNTSLGTIVIDRWPNNDEKGVPLALGQPGERNGNGEDSEYERF